MVVPMSRLMVQNNYIIVKNNWLIYFVQWKMIEKVLLYQHNLILILIMYHVKHLWHIIYNVLFYMLNFIEVINYIYKSQDFFLRWLWYKIF